MESEIPSLGDISTHDSLDERKAVEHFLGKNVKEAEDLFREDFFGYSEDLMWMGPTAFCYYLPAALAYLLSQDANGNSGAASAFCSVINHRLDWERNAIQPALPALRRAIPGILADISRYECDPLIYGDMRKAYKDLLKRVCA